jgi:hypothetical protein
MFLMTGTAAPEITSEYWMDTFDDETGIESWDNLELIAGDIQLTKGVTFYEGFTGNNGDPPNPLVWDVIDDGYTLEIENNQLKSYINVDIGSYKGELVQTNRSFPANHVITWQQQLHLIGDGNGMFYHVYVLNGSDDSNIFGVNQNHLNEYHAYNVPASTTTQIDSFVTGWHDFKIIFNNGYMEFYKDNVKEYEYDFNVQSVKYQFGSGTLAEVSTILTDNITLTSYVPSGNLTSTEIDLPPGNTWDSAIINKSQSPGNDIKTSVLDGLTLLPIPGFEDLTGDILDISSIDRITYPSIRLRAHFSSDGGNTSLLHDWKVTFSDITPPDTPTGLKVTNPYTGYSLILSWNPNSEPDLVIYRIYFSTNNVAFSWLGDVSSYDVSFIHYGLSIGDTCYYKIAAVDTDGNPSSNTTVVFSIPDIDTDGDQIGNLVDDDDDGDTVPDIDDEFPVLDNEWIDTDSDGIGDNADYDDDDDGYDDTIDDFPLNITEWNDLDDDGIGDNSDIDKDGDGIANIDDEFPENPTEWVDTDSDGLGDNKDLDLDGDSVTNSNDEFPYDESESNDLDDDGIGDNADSDRDGDGIANGNDDFPDNPLEWKDLDLDGVGDNADLDDDGDTYLDVNDVFPYNNLEWWDMDSDGIGDNSDSDKDGDGVGNNADLFPTLSHEWKDHDLDGIGDNSDPDDDNDKHPDTNDDYPYDSSRWQKPNELLFWLYLIVILLIILIVICIIILKTKKDEEPQHPNDKFFNLQNKEPIKEAHQIQEGPKETDSLHPSTEPLDDDLPPPPPSD